VSADVADWADSDPADYPLHPLDPLVFTGSSILILLGSYI
jgi:hypothetical protein